MTAAWARVANAHGPVPSVMPLVFASWSSAAFTLNVYGYVTEEMKQASADRMDMFIKGTSGA